LTNLNPTQTIEKLALKMRKTALKMAFDCGEPAHIGGGLSIIDILATLYGYIMNNPGKNDRFILSKGHGVLGLYSALYEMGFMTAEDISSFQTNGSKFIAHPIMNIDAGIESSNGSLGQGLSMAIGLSIAYKKSSNPNQIFVIVGDGECYEGSIWEAAITAAEQNLDNLTVIVDCNGYQNDGAVSLEMECEQMAAKWKGFGWNTISCDGHNVSSLINVFRAEKIEKPKVLIAKTTKGKGITFMEDNNDWHHNRLSQKLYDEAIRDLVS
jgi:transketolase